LNPFARKYYCEELLTREGRKRKPGRVAAEWLLAPAEIDSLSTDAIAIKEMFANAAASLNT
jgi:hypothetical protein